jgi:hypothetical protein
MDIFVHHEIFAIKSSDWQKCVDNVPYYNKNKL